MALCKTAVTPLLTHWSYYSLALSHRYMLAQQNYVIMNILSLSVRQDNCHSNYIWFQQPHRYLLSEISAVHRHVAMLQIKFPQQVDSLITPYFHARNRYIKSMREPAVADLISVCTTE